MSLTSKPKPPKAHQQIHAAHHRHSKSYLKTYWPYIPIVGLIMLGFVINHYYWTATTNGAISNRLSSYSFLDILESSIGILAFAIFLLRHAFAWHKVLVKGEAFVTKHPLLDIALVAVAMVGILLAHKGVAVI